MDIKIRPAGGWADGHKRYRERFDRCSRGRHRQPLCGGVPANEEEALDAAGPTQGTLLVGLKDEFEVDRVA